MHISKMSFWIHVHDMILQRAAMEGGGSRSISDLIDRQKNQFVAFFSSSSDTYLIDASLSSTSHPLDDALSSNYGIEQKRWITDLQHIIEPSVSSPNRFGNISAGSEP